MYQPLEEGVQKGLVPGEKAPDPLLTMCSTLNPLAKGLKPDIHLISNVVVYLLKPSHSGSVEFPEDDLLMFVSLLPQCSTQL